MHWMKFAVLTVLLTSFVAVAGESEKKMEIRVVKAGQGDDVEVNWSGDAIDLEGLAVGEQKVLANGSGEPLTITRTEDGLSFIVDGETIDIPNIGAEGAHMAYASAGDKHHNALVEIIGEHDEDVDVHVIRGGSGTMNLHGADGITIITGQPLDASVKETIRSVLISAGRDDTVQFIDGHSESRQVKVIRRNVDIIED
ncbi:MAG: hypothetical protein K0U72_01410 [Gammaproteobacteria bacterium]|nr:hypothetical protein [Gammaproteobacteria bacterium]